MNIQIDATNEKLGRLASKIAFLLQGKNDPKYNPRISGDVRVAVTNAGKVVVSGNKSTQKIYYHHTGYMGHLREKRFIEEFEKSPEKILRGAIYNMLPKNRLRNDRLKRLTISM